jgi:malate dehydrogenase (oxaloacetate-decarboxylating)
MTQPLPKANGEQFDWDYAREALDICRSLSADPSLAYKLTNRFNSVAVITDGSSVPGLGDIGPLASLPLVEQKSRLLFHSAQINAYPLVIDSPGVDDMVRTIMALSSCLGAVNLEAVNEVSSMEIKRRLSEIDQVPVFQDTLDALPVLCLAALLNALKVVGKKMSTTKIVIVSGENEGLSMVDFFRLAGATDIIVCDKAGAIHRGRPGHTNWVKEELALKTNPRQLKGPLAKVTAGADVLIVLTPVASLTKDLVASMAPKAIVFDLTDNQSDNFLKATVTATCRADLNNQLSLCLVFPGLLRGTLDARARSINPTMKMAATLALSKLVPEAELTPEFIVPLLTKSNIVSVLAEAVSTAAAASGASRLI